MAKSKKQEELLKTVSLLSDGATCTVGELANSIIEEFGGAKGLAEALFDVFRNPETAQHVKAKILSDCFDVIRNANVLNPPEDEDLSDADNEELASELESLMRSTNLLES